MIDQTNEKLPQLVDSFYDDDDDDSTPSRAPITTETNIVTSKPPIYRPQPQNSPVSSSTSDTSDHDITDVSSINEHSRPPFHLQSMKTVLFGLSDRSSGLPSPADTDRQQLGKNDSLLSFSQQKHVRSQKKDSQRFRITSSAINRQQQQKRIERENLVSLLI